MKISFGPSDKCFIESSENPQDEESCSFYGFDASNYGNYRPSAEQYENLRMRYYILYRTLGKELLHRFCKKRKLGPLLGENYEWVQFPSY